MLAKNIPQALKFCKGISATPTNALMRVLWDAACSMADHLGDAIIKMTPCKYNAATVENAIDGLRYSNSRSSLDYATYY